MDFVVASSIRLLDRAREIREKDEEANHRIIKRLDLEENGKLGIHNIYINRFGY